MHYYTLGNSGLRVSRLALGTITFGTELGWGSDQETSRAIFSRYRALGGNLLDTSDLYTGGTSETWLGEFIKDAGARDEVVISTKFSYNLSHGNPNAGGNGRKHMIAALERSLKRLQTDYVDLFLVHSWDMITPAEEVLRTFDDLVRSGKVRYCGLSNVPGWYAARMQTIAELRGLVPLTALELEYSLIQRGIEQELLPFGINQGVGTMVWSPLAGGLLTGKYSRDDSGGLAPGSGRLETIKNSPMSPVRITEDSWKILDALKEVAREADRSMAQVAINWAANRPGVDSVIIGATSMKQLENNMASLDFDLTPGQMQRLDQVSAPDLPYPHSFLVPKMQAMITGGAVVGDKPATYYPRFLSDAQMLGMPTSD